MGNSSTRVGISTGPPGLRFETVHLEPESSLLRVPRGRLTFEAEGSESAINFSRIVHKPAGKNAGVTIGRGYDMGGRSALGIRNDLERAGVPRFAAVQFQSAAGLKGARAQQYVDLRKTKLPVLSLAQQARLFTQVVYPRYEQETERLVTKIDVQKKYGRFTEAQWRSLHPGIREVLVDLTYRGDFTPSSRRHLQPHLVRNDLRGVLADLSNRALWPRVPLTRFRARIEFLARQIVAQ